MRGGVGCGSDYIVRLTTAKCANFNCGHTIRCLSRWDNFTSPRGLTRKQPTRSRRLARGRVRNRKVPNVIRNQEFQVDGTEPPDKMGVGDDSDCKDVYEPSPTGEGRENIGLGGILALHYKCNLPLNRQPPRTMEDFNDALKLLGLFDVVLISEFLDEKSTSTILAKTLGLHTRLGLHANKGWRDHAGETSEPRESLKLPVALKRWKQNVPERALSELLDRNALDIRLFEFAIQLYDARAAAGEAPSH